MLAASLEGFRLRGAVIGTPAARAALHHESGAIVRNMGNHRLAVVKSHRVIEAYGKHEVHNGSGREFHGLQFQEDSRGRQVPCPAATNPPARHPEVNGGGHPVSFKQTTFQRSGAPSEFGRCDRRKGCTRPKRKQNEEIYVATAPVETIRAVPGYGSCKPC